MMLWLSTCVMQCNVMAPVTVRNVMSSRSNQHVRGALPPVPVLVEGGHMGVCAQ